MREIKFRVWDKRTKTLKYPVPYDDGEHDCPESLKGKYCPATLKDKNGNTTALSDAIMSHNDDGLYVLMQYTGLKDKNGKDIYEGDIVRIGKFSDGIEGYVEFIQNTLFEDGKWYLTWTGWALEYYKNKTGEESNNGAYHLSCEDNREIIGNIYENPELLNRAKEGAETVTD